jgi:hypothetical protein
MWSTVSSDEKQFLPHQSSLYLNGTLLKLQAIKLQKKKTLFLQKLSIFKASSSPAQGIKLSFSQ